MCHQSDLCGGSADPRAATPSPLRANSLVFRQAQLFLRFLTDVRCQRNFQVRGRLCRAISRCETRSCRFTSRLHRL